MPLLVLAVGILCAGPATAADSVQMQALLNDDGSGRLFVNSFGYGWSWEACSTDLSSCGPFTTGQDIRVGGVAPNTVFRVSGSAGTGLSPVWNGNLESVAPPRVHGVVRANELVRPVPAVWRGGWDGDFDQTQLAACSSPAGDHCVTLTEPKYLGCRDEAAVIDPMFTGDYLRVADQRFGVGSIFTDDAATSPFGHRLWPASTRTAVAIVGRIRRATGPRATECGPPPLIEVSISSSGTAKVKCDLGCRAALVAKRGQHTARIVRVLTARRFPRLTGPTELKLSPQDLAHLGPGRAHLVVEIDGRPAAHRTVRLG